MFFLIRERSRESRERSRGDRSRSPSGSKHSKSRSRSPSPMNGDKSPEKQKDDWATVCTLSTWLGKEINFFADFFYNWKYKLYTTQEANHLSRQFQDTTSRANFHFYIFIITIILLIELHWSLYPRLMLIQKK